MSTLALGTFLKVGAVVVATGASIATPILLSARGNPSSALKSSSSSDVSQDISSVGDSHSPVTKTVNGPRDTLSEGGARVENLAETPANSVNTDNSDPRAVSPSPEGLPREQEEVQRASEDTRG